MKRNHFLKALAAAGSLLSLPFSGLAKSISPRRFAKGFKVDNGKDRFDKAINLFEGDTFYTKVSTQDTDGDLYIYESTRVKKGGPALHQHFNQDETWYVLEGEFLIKVGADTYTAKAGDTVFGPRGVPHTFAKINEGNGRLLMTFQPAGKMEAFFIATAAGTLKDMPLPQQDEFRKQHGFERMGPALDYEKKPG